MTIRVECPCGRHFEAAEALAGGLANCPHCGRAAEVPGLRDPFWRLLQAAAAVLWAGATVAAFARWGLVGAVAAAAVAAALLWSLSRAL